MPVTIEQSPTTPNVTGTNLVYSLVSNNANNPQFRYVTDIYNSGSGEYITTIKTYPNISGSGIVDVARELDDQLDYDYNWKVTGSVSYVESYKSFDIRFGEEYAPSYSGSITIYTGSTSDRLGVFPGIVYKNEGSYNWDYQEYFTRDYKVLSNVPVRQSSEDGEDKLYITKDDYHTITIYPADSSFTANVYDVDDVLLGIRALSGSNFYTVGIGPQNLIDYGMPSSTFDTAARITIVGLGTPEYNLYLPFTPTHPGCNGEHTRFAFINEYGFWDYYTVYNPLRRNTKVDRKTYDKTFVDYSSNISNYNVSNTGTKQYYTEYSDTYEITTDYLSKDTADWLVELIESPEVFVQQNGNFVPINITNSSSDWNMEDNRTKLFQYTIEFVYANERQPR